MHIWVDADACPKVIKEILFKASKRLSISMTLVANKPMYVPESDLVDFVLVPAGFDVADNHIVEHVNAGELVISEDVPLAAAAIEKGAEVITPRGRVYTRENIGEQLSLRNFMDDLRSTGVETGGPRPLDKKDRENFANALNRFLS